MPLFRRDPTRYPTALPSHLDRTRYPGSRVLSARHRLRAECTAKRPEKSTHPVAETAALNPDEQQFVGHRSHQLQFGERFPQAGECGSFAYVQMFE